MKFQFLDLEKVEDLSASIENQLELLTIIQSHVADALQLIRQGDAAERQSQLHQLKGHLPLLCVDELSEVLLREYTYIQQNKQSSANLEDLLSMLESLLAEVSSHLEELNQRT